MLLRNRFVRTLDSNNFCKLGAAFAAGCVTALRFGRNAELYDCIAGPLPADDFAFLRDNECLGCCKGWNVLGAAEVGVAEVGVAEVGVAEVGAADRS